MTELEILKGKIEEEIRISRQFQQQKREEIDALRYDIRYYEGQIDALNLTLTTVEKTIKDAHDCSNR